MHSILRLGSFELNPLPKEEDERAKRAQERRERGREGERARFLWEGGPESPEACDASFPRFCFCLSLSSPPKKAAQEEARSEKQRSPQRREKRGELRSAVSTARPRQLRHPTSRTSSSQSLGVQKRKRERERERGPLLAVLKKRERERVNSNVRE